MNLSKVTEKGQVTLPADLRRRFGIRRGKSVAFVATRDGILVKPVEVKDLTGTPQWKRKLESARADARAGRVRRFYSDREYLEQLEATVQHSKRNAAPRAKGAIKRRIP